MLGGAPVSTFYAWDLLGRLNELRDANQNKWSYTYDSLGRRTQGEGMKKGDASLFWREQGDARRWLPRFGIMPATLPCKASERGLGRFGTIGDGVGGSRPASPGRNNRGGPA